MKISSNFDSGNISVVSYTSPYSADLEINKDKESDFFQWFYFRLQGCKNKKVTLRIVNAASASFPEGWENYKAVASYDRKNWFRVDTSYINGVLNISITPKMNSIYFAYFAPYSNEDHLDLLGHCEKSNYCEIMDLGSTLDGRDINLLQIGSFSPEKKTIWITGRQHPGESMAEWLCDGLINRLLDQNDPIISKLLDKACFYICPNMNPDGTVRGHLRSNSAGINLNREWSFPTESKSPEVYHIRRFMINTGVDLFLDIHGDEVLPYVFAVGCEGNPNYNERINYLEDIFKEKLLAATPDFQVIHGYPKSKPFCSDLSWANNWVGQNFNCLSLTIEMPFKDNAAKPDPIHGWSPERSKSFGRSILNSIYGIIDELR